MTRPGLAGNEQADLVNHGGADKAVCVYFSHHYSHWEPRLGFGLTQGAFGENLTMSGFDETTICIGDVMTVGTVRVEVSQPRQPCYKLASRHTTTPSPPHIYARTSLWREALGDLDH